MSELRLRRRTRLKRKAAHALREEVAAAVGIRLWGDEAAVETADVTPELQAILVDGTIHGLVRDGAPFLSVRGLLAYRPTVRWATVDMGAIRFVHNGADVMAPGITEADPALEVGDWVWIRDEKNGQPLAVGRCLMTGSEMAQATSGKAIENVHHIGDKVWELDD